MGTRTNIGIRQNLMGFSDRKIILYKLCEHYMICRKIYFITIEIWGPNSLQKKEIPFIQENTVLAGITYFFVDNYFGHQGS